MIAWDLLEICAIAEDVPFISIRRKFPFLSGIERNSFSWGKSVFRSRSRQRTWTDWMRPDETGSSLLFQGSLSLIAFFRSVPSVGRFFNVHDSLSTWRDGIALTTGTLASLCPYSGHATKLLHPHNQLRINRGYRKLIQFVLLSISTSFTSKLVEKLR